MNKIVEIAIVKGEEAYSLQIWGEHGGYRYIGPKAWGNPYNKPLVTFKVNVNDFIKYIEKYSYEIESDKE